MKVRPQTLLFRGDRLIKHLKRVVVVPVEIRATASNSLMWQPAHILSAAQA
jgi:hypothetical protein